MTLHTPVAMQPGGSDPTINYSAQEWRQYTIAMLAGEAAAFEGGQGVTVTDAPSSGAMTGGYAVTQRGAGANFSVDVAAGHAFVTGGDVTNQGPYMVWNDGTVNVSCPSPPASGTRVHRLVLQIQDKLANAVWTGYTAALVLLQDTGSGTPAQPASAITLALITENAGDPSIQNAAIADYRRCPGDITAVKAGSSPTSRSSTTSLADDPDLWLIGFATGGLYQLDGYIKYDGGSGSNEGDLQWTFRTGGNLGGNYQVSRYGTGSGNPYSGGDAYDLASTHTAFTNGTGNPNSLRISGLVIPGATAPNNTLVFQWAQNTSHSTATRLFQGSWLRARRLF